MTLLKHDEDASSVRRLLPGDTGQDPFKGFDEARAKRKAELALQDVPRYISDEESKGEAGKVPPIGARADLPKSDTAAGALTAERGQTHGDFRDHAAFTQHLKDAIRSCQRLDGTHPWDGLTPSMKESLDMNMHKIGRVLAGKAEFKDHWADMAGYSQLVADECPD